MAGTSFEKRETGRKFETAIVLVVALSPLVLVFSRESPVAILALLTALAIASAVVRRGIRQALADFGAATIRGPILILAAALTYTTASVAWSVVPARGGEFALHMAATSVGAVALFTFGRQLDARRLAPALSIGLLLASALVVFEMKNGLAVRGMLGISTGGTTKLKSRSHCHCPLSSRFWGSRSEGQVRSLPLIYFTAVAAPSVYAAYIAISSTAHLVLLLLMVVIPACMLAPRAMHRLATLGHHCGYDIGHRSMSGISTA